MMSGRTHVATVCRGLLVVCRFYYIFFFICSFMGLFLIVSLMVAYFQRYFGEAHGSTSTYLEQQERVRRRVGLMLAFHMMNSMISECVIAVVRSHRHCALLLNTAPHRFFFRGYYAGTTTGRSPCGGVNPSATALWTCCQRWCL